MAPTSASPATQVPEAAFVMLACTRIGAPHSVVFAGFSADALRDRILDGGCEYVITADEGCRGGRRIPLKAVTDEALHECPDVKCCIVHRRTGAEVEMDDDRDVWLHEICAQQRGYCVPEEVRCVCVCDCVSWLVGACVRACVRACVGHCVF